MSELKVNDIETTRLQSNSITVGNTTTIDGDGIHLDNRYDYTWPVNPVINSTSIQLSSPYIYKWDDPNIRTKIDSTINVKAIFLKNSPNVFPYSNDIFAWTNSVWSYQVIEYERDYNVEPSPYGGIPIRIQAELGVDKANPHLGTYNDPYWNLATTKQGDVWQLSGWVRTDRDIIDVYQYYPNFFDLLGANSSSALTSWAEWPWGGQIGATHLFKANTWYRFSLESDITTSDSAFLQLLIKGVPQCNTWYDGIEIRKGITVLSPEVVNSQIFTANGTWVKPEWATVGNELVIVNMWGGGGGANAAGQYPGGGGAYSFGYFTSSQCNAICNVVVGIAGQPGQNGGNSVFWSNSTTAIYAYGGGSANSSRSGGGGGWLSAGSVASSGGPLGGALGSTGGDSTFGGGGASNSTSPWLGGSSIYGGGGGTGSTGGRSVYGGGGGTWDTGPGGISVYGGHGGNSTVSGGIPGGGGGAGTGIATAGGRGEIRIYTLRNIN
jgi:hypothetical protein